MPSKTENLKLNICYEDEKVKDWLDYSDQNFEIIDNTIGKLINEIAVNSVNLSSAIDLNEPYGTRVEEYQTLSYSPYNGHTSGVLISNYIYFFCQYGAFYKYNIKSKSNSTLPIQYSSDGGETIISYNTLPDFLFQTIKVAWNNKIILISTNEIDNTIYEYDPNENLFVLSDLTLPMVYPFSHVPYVCIGYNIYLFGARSGNSVYSYKIDLLNRTSSTINFPIEAKFGLAVEGPTNQYVYIFGKRTISSLPFTIYKYDTINNTYEDLNISLSNMANNSFTGYRMDNLIYIFGGVRTSGTVSSTTYTCKNTIYTFNTLNNTLTLLNLTLPEPLSFIDCGYKNGDIYIFGGKVDQGRYTESSDQNDNLKIYRYVKY